RVAAGVAGGGGDDLVELGQPVWWHVGCGHRPAVGFGADELNRARADDAEPEADVVRGTGTRPDAWYLVVGALVAVGFTGPAGADDVDGLAERAAGLPGAAAGAAHSGDPVGERSRAEAELEAAAAEHVDGGGLLGEHDRRAQRQVGDVGEQVHVPGPGGQPGDQGEGVGEVVVVGMV